MAVTAGASFGFPPTWVFPEEPEFHNIVTQSESMRKEYYGMSGATPIKMFRIVFSGVSDAGYNGGTGINDHFLGQSGGFSAFYWTSVPSYVNSGTSILGRWIDGSFKATPRANSWDIEITFEKDASIA